MKRKIINKAMCLKCGDIIESKHTHDYVTCSCGNLSVDGGQDYFKRNFRDGTDSWKDLSICEEDILEGDGTNGETSL